MEEVSKSPEDKAAEALEKESALKAKPEAKAKAVKVEVEMEFSYVTKEREPLSKCCTPAEDGDRLFSPMVDSCGKSPHQKKTASRHITTFRSVA